MQTFKELNHDLWYFQYPGKIASTSFYICTTKAWLSSTSHWKTSGNIEQDKGVFKWSPVFTWGKLVVFLMSVNTP